MDDDAEAERWAAAGRAVEAQRGALGLTQEEAAERAQLSDDVWRQVARGQFAGRKASTLAQISRALEWPPDQLERMLRGEPPPWVSYDARVEALEAGMAELRQTVSDALAVLDDLRRQRDS